MKEFYKPQQLTKMVMNKWLGAVILCNFSGHFFQPFPLNLSVHFVCVGNTFLIARVKKRKAK